MRIARLGSLLLAAALGAASASAAVAAPATTPHALVERAPALAPARTTDAARYAALEAQDRSVEKFRGGREIWIIGGSTLTIVLVVVLVIILI
jgi:hypothetical protein